MRFRKPRIPAGKEQRMPTGGNTKGQRNGRSGGDKNRSRQSGKYRTYPVGGSFIFGGEAVAQTPVADPEFADAQAFDIEIGFEHCEGELFHPRKDRWG